MRDTGTFATPFCWSATRPYSRASPRCRGAPIRREERVGERWDQDVRGSRAFANHPKRVTTRTEPADYAGFPAAADEQRIAPARERVLRPTASLADPRITSPCSTRSTRRPASVVVDVIPSEPL